MSENEIKPGFTDKAISKDGLYLLPAVNASLTAQKYTPLKTEQPENITAHMVLQQQLVAEGDLSFIEETLIAQAGTLDTMFNHLARLAHTNSGSLEKLEKLTRLALKAQQQTTNTLKVLSEHKQPKHYVLAKQANIAQGHQQVNNGGDNKRGSTTSRTHAHMENEKSENELLEGINHERVDAGTQEATSRVDQEVEAVGAINGS